METLSPNDLVKVFTNIPFNKMLGLQVDTIEKDRVSMSFVMKPDLIGNFMHGILHGGVISSVLDMAGGVAAITSAIRRYKDKGLIELKTALSKTSTINLHINYVNPGKGKKFIATSCITRSGKKICFTHSELKNEEGILIATGAGTYLVG